MLVTIYMNLIQRPAETLTSQHDIALFVRVGNLTIIQSSNYHAREHTLVVASTVHRDTGDEDSACVRQQVRFVD
tara:strand:- start:308 stop:529 length:222 start_codon:yes stop_codon:yes gene_type:complete